MQELAIVFYVKISPILSNPARTAIVPATGLKPATSNGPKVLHLKSLLQGANSSSKELCRSKSSYTERVAISALAKAVWCDWGGVVRYHAVPPAVVSAASSAAAGLTVLPLPPLGLVFPQRLQPSTRAGGALLLQTLCLGVTPV